MIRLKFISLFLSLLIIIACSGKSEPPELKKAAHIIKYMMASKNLSRSAFSVAFDNPTPSQFVSYIFSVMGSAEWPPSVMEMSPDEAKMSGIPLMPEGIAYVSREKDMEKGKQIVVNYDDGRGVVIVKGFTDPKEEAVLLREWSLPKKIKPAPGAKDMYDSNLQMGMSIQSF